MPPASSPCVLRVPQSCSDPLTDARSRRSQEPSVKRVVLTSSFASVLDFDKLGPETTFTEKDWNPATYDSAKKADQPPYVSRLPPLPL